MLPWSSHVFLKMNLWSLSCIWNCEDANCEKTMSESGWRSNFRIPGLEVIGPQRCEFFVKVFAIQGWNFVFKMLDLICSSGWKIFEKLPEVGGTESLIGHLITGVRNLASVSEPHVVRFFARVFVGDCLMRFWWLSFVRPIGTSRVESHRNDWPALRFMWGWGFKPQGRSPPNGDPR